MAHVTDNATAYYRGMDHDRASLGSNDDWVDQKGAPAYDLVPETGATFVSDGFNSHWLFTDTPLQELIMAADEDAFDPGSGDFTIVAIVDFDGDGTGTNRMLVDKRATAGQGWQMFGNTADRLTGTRSSDVETASDVTTGDFIVDEQTAAVLRHDDTSNEIVVSWGDREDGYFIFHGGSPVTATGTVANSVAVRVGSNQADGERHDGKVYALGIWMGTLLTDDEVEEAIAFLSGMSGDVGDRDHLYIEQDTTETTTSATYARVPGMTISRSMLKASTKYMVLARAVIGGSSVTDKHSFRILTADDTDIETLSESVVEANVSYGTTRGMSYTWARSFSTDSAPADLEMQFAVDGGSTGYVTNPSLLLLNLTEIGVEGTDYHEVLNAGGGSEYTFGSGNNRIFIDGSTLGTDEYVVFGAARVGVGSTGRWFRHVWLMGRDSVSSQVMLHHQAEGEDTSEFRVVGFMGRHHDAAGTADVIFSVQEEAGNANMFSEGEYAIAIKSEFFADFGYEIDIIPNTVTTEETVESISYTSTAPGSHLVIGQTHRELGDANANLLQLHMEDGTTEIRSADSAQFHNQVWDSTKAEEYAATLQRIFIDGSKTYNLRATSTGAGVSLEDSTLMVLNFAKPIVPALWIPNRRQLTTVRM